MKEEFETYADALWWGLVSQSPLSSPRRGGGLLQQRRGGSGPGQLHSAAPGESWDLLHFPSCLWETPPAGLHIEYTGFPWCL